VKGDGGCREDGGNSECCGKYVEEAADECAERGLDSFAAAACQAARQNIENSWTGRDG
jgi:hypothetical protein